MDNTVQVVCWDPGMCRFYRQALLHNNAQELCEPLTFHVDALQMHKMVPPAPEWKALVIRHQHWRQRAYYVPDLDR